MRCRSDKILPYKVARERGSEHLENLEKGGNERRRGAKSRKATQDMKSIAFKLFGWVPGAGSIPKSRKATQDMISIAIKLIGLFPGALENVIGRKI